MTIQNVIKNTFGKLMLLGAVGLSSTLVSCDDLVYDNRDNCVSGVQLKFVYDYHMERGANSFPANVDCITVYVFDTDGNYIDKYTETTEVLREDHYRMILPLEDGEYRLMVYGGLTCEHSKFKITPDWGAARADGLKLSDIRISRPLDDDNVSREKLHDLEERTGGLFYGYAIDGETGPLYVSVSNPDYGTEYTEHVVHLMKDTNNIQVMLQELAYPNEINHEDYNFMIVDDNFILDHNNAAVSVVTDTHQPQYHPYQSENRIVGFVDNSGRDGTVIQPDMSNPVQIGCVEFSTSRLLVNNLEKSRLIITTNLEHNADGSPKTVVDIPLISYLAVTRGFGSNWIKSDQEYLDRQSNWNLMFFLQRGAWVSATVAVNDWIVRVNNVELGS